LAVQLRGVMAGSKNDDFTADWLKTQALINANRPETRIWNLLELGEEDTHPLIKEAYHRAVVGRSSEGLPRDIWVLVEAAYELAVTHSTAPEADMAEGKREYDGDGWGAVVGTRKVRGGA